MKVALTGATGFTGSHTLPKLLADGYSVRCLVRNPRDVGVIAAFGVEVVQGDLADPQALHECFGGCGALVNIASLGFGHAPGIVAAAEKAGVRRAIFVSTTSVFTKLNAKSKTVRLAAEDTVLKSRLGWTIIRPTMIYGTAQDRNICRLIRYVRRWPVLPVFGSGNALVQPIHVDDLAEVLVAALNTTAAARKVYNVSGAEPLAFNDLARTVAEILGRRVKLLHIPAGPIVQLLHGIERMKVCFPIKAEQILRLQEDKTFSWADAGRDLRFQPRTFRDGVRSEIELICKTLPISLIHSPH